MSIFTSLLAIVATARLIPQDIEDRTVYTILAKPVPRFEYVLGKLAGVLLLLAISTLITLYGRALCARTNGFARDRATNVGRSPRTGR
jgi:ABC-type transport system involved in multi-copper enzyme maturation permease subunit